MAGWPPEKNTAFVWEFYLRDADGDLIAGATALDVEYSIDGGAFSDVAGTEVDEGEGLYSCPISSGEMNGDRIALICKTGTAGVKTAGVVIYTSTRQIDDLAYPATSGRSIQVESDGMIHGDLKEWLGTAPLALVAQRVSVSVGAMANNVITSNGIATDAIGALELAAGAVNKIRDAILSDSTSFPGASITEVRMATLTDLIDGGRLDLLLDEIKAVTDAQTATGTGLTGIPWNASYHAYDGPRGPGVYLNDAAANTNTVNGTDGIIGNPVSTIAAAKTIADSLGYDRIYLVNDSAITLAVPMADYEFVGIGELAANSINLGSQSVNNSSFHNLMVTGTQGGTGRISIFGGAISSVVNIQCTAIGCALLGNITLDAGNDTFLVGCWSGVAGTGTHELTFTANANVSVRHFSGGIQINSMAATNNMSFEAVGGQLIIDATCTGGIVATRGNITKTDNAGGAVTVSDDARIDVDQIKAQVDQALTEYGANTVTPPTVIAIRTEMDTNSADLNLLLTLITAARMGALDDWIDGGRLDLLIDLIKAKTDALPSGPAKNVALANFEFLMVLSSDDVTPATGLSVTGEISKDGAAFTALANAITEIANGFYKVDLDAAELNVDVLGLKFTAATANQLSMVFLTT